MWRDMDVFLKVLEVIFIATVCQARALPAPKQARLSIAESMPYYYYNNIDGHPGTYSFGYDVSDPSTGNTQFRTEERYPNGTVVGSYGYVDASGRPYRFNYVADERGYRVMRDRPKNPYVYQTTLSPILSTENMFSTTESSITWTRPSKRRNKNEYTTNQIKRRNYNMMERQNFASKQNNVIKYPRFYV